MHQHLQASGAQREQIHPPVYSTQIPPAHTLSPVDQYASYLRSVYTSMKLPTYSKWPPSSSKKFIHLAVVRKEKVSKKEADEFTRATIHRTEIDDIYRKKEAVDFNRVGKMKDGLLANLILVEGAPGIGKTTFAWEVCRKWAHGEILREYGLVVLLRLRDKRVREVKTVFDLFHHPNPELSSAVGTEILHHEGESVLLLYEGYDELPRKLQKQQSIFLDVLHKNYLPRATILITSRPSATGYLRWEFKKQISQHIEILGFTKDDINSYIHDVIEDEQVCKDFHQYLKCYPYIRGMMYVPLNAVIVTEVYKSSQQSPENFIPTTMTELYTALTKSLLLRYLNSHSEYGQQEWNLKVFADLPKELYKQFCDVTAVALKGMIEDTFVFDDLPNDFNTLDLMQSVPELYIQQGALVSYNFFHLTLQEYLAAVNISHQPIEKQIEFLQISTDDSTHELPSIFEMHQPLVHGTMTHSRPPHSHTPHHDNPSYSQPPFTSSIPPPQCSKLNPHAKPFIPQHLFFTPGASPLLSIPTQNTLTPVTLLHPPNVHPPNLGIPHPFLATVPQPRALTHSKNVQQQLSQSYYYPPQCNLLPRSRSLHPKPSHCQDLLRYSSFHQTTAGISTPLPVHISLEHQPHTQPSVPHHYCQPHKSSTTVQYPSTQYLYPHNHPTVTSPIPRMMHPYPHTMLTHAGDFMGDCTYYNTHPTLPPGIMDPESSALTRTGRFGTIHNSVTSDASIIPIPSTTTLPESGSRASSIQLSLPDLNGPGISTRLRNVLRFVAGLTKFKGIPLASLQPLVLEPFNYEDKHMTLKSLHWLFETQCCDTYNEVVSPYHLFTSYHNNELPFDYFVLGYAMASITTHWEIVLHNDGIDVEDIEMLAAGVSINRDNFTQSKENRMLQQLHVRHNSIGHGGATALAEMLKENSTLQQLGVSYNSIGDGGATALAEMLKENSTLQQLDVSRNCIGHGGATALAEMLKENSTLQQLDVSSNSIGHGGATALAEMLKENSTLQQLDVSNNSIGHGGATALAEMLKENSTLQQLDVSNNSIGHGGATALAEMLKENSTLQQLDVSNNSIGHGGATALAEMLKENSTLQQLDVSSNSIGHGGATALAEMLKENSTLQQLDVSSNSIGHGGATALAEMLKENSTLQQLDVSSNSIGHGGATAPAEMLKENSTLQQLDVSNNSIGHGGATALAEILKENSTLQQLDVSSNSIGHGGATALAEMLKENSTLQQLDVSSNSIGDGGTTALAETLKENSTLQQLNVSHNSIGDGGATALVEMLKENSTLQRLKASISDVVDAALADVLQLNETVDISIVNDNYNDDYYYNKL